MRKEFICECGNLLCRAPIHVGDLIVAGSERELYCSGRCFLKCSKDDTPEGKAKKKLPRVFVPNGH